MAPACTFGAEILAQEARRRPCCKIDPAKFLPSESGVIVELSTDKHTSLARPETVEQMNCTPEVLSVGTKFYIATTGPEQLLFCDNCMQPRVGLPSFWFRKK